MEKAEFVARAPWISAGCLRVAIEHLGMLKRRSAGSLKEAAITGGRPALVEFAKKHFGDLLNYVWKFWF
jgi:hypothetical protein